jgi:hypothetical protein
MLFVEAARSDPGDEVETRVHYYVFEDAIPSSFANREGYQVVNQELYD